MLQPSFIDLGYFWKHPETPKPQPGCVERMVNHAFGGHEEKTVNFSDSEDSEQTDEKGGQVLSKGKKSIGFKTFLEWAHHYHMVIQLTL